MPEFVIDWSKTYVACGQEVVKAETEGDAEQVVWDKLGDLTGSMNYDPNEDYVECAGEIN